MIRFCSSIEVFDCGRLSVCFIFDIVVGVWIVVKNLRILSICFVDLIIFGDMGVCFCFDILFVLVCNVYIFNLLLNNW